jgi:hypothetical protein
MLRFAPSLCNIGWKIHRSDIMSRIHRLLTSEWLPLRYFIHGITESAGWPHDCNAGAEFEKVLNWVWKPLRSKQGRQSVYTLPGTVALYLSLTRFKNVAGRTLSWHVQRTYPLPGTLVRFLFCTCWIIGDLLQGKTVSWRCFWGRWRKYLDRYSGYGSVGIVSDHGLKIGVQSSAGANNFLLVCASRLAVGPRCLYTGK